MASSPETSNSYFVGELAQRARSDQLAAPVDVSDLIAKLTYLNPTEIRQIRVACKYAEKAHEGQTRKTGHAYITHPLAVAGILAELEADYETVAAGVLHDVIEDCDVSRDSLAKIFGDTIANIVEGVSKLNISGPNKVSNADIVHKLLDASTKDPRVIYVKLADRLHNAQTLAVMAKDRRLDIATETLDLYAPIAQRLGIYRIRNEMQDRAFEAKHSFRADHLRHAVSNFEQENQKTIRKVTNQIQAYLNQRGISATVHYYPPHLYAIYQKMKAGGLKFGDVMASLNFCVLVDSKEPSACYSALGAVHQVYKHDQRGFRDYVAAPKHNGYQALHTTVIGPHGGLLKVQIRTLSMERCANRGITVTDIQPYSAGPFSQIISSFTDSIKDIEAQSLSATEFLDTFKRSVNAKQILVYTPDNEVIHLPTGATVIDFAYKISTELGNQCFDSFVDGQRAPISTVLESGQTVRIVCSEDSSPNPAWLSIATTVRALNAIKNELDQNEHDHAVEIGSQLLEKEVNRAGIKLADLDFRSHRKLYRELNVKRRENLLEKIGRGHLQARSVALKLLSTNTNTLPDVYLEGGQASVGIVDQRIPATYAQCCGPVPGDRIVGHYTQSRGLVVHRRACLTGKADSKVDRQLLRWGDVDGTFFETSVQIWATSDGDSLYRVHNILRMGNAQVQRIEVLPHQGVMQSIRVSLGVKNLNHLNRVLRSLRMAGFVGKVLRSGDKLPV